MNNDNSNNNSNLDMDMLKEMEEILYGKLVYQARRKTTGKSAYHDKSLVISLARRYLKVADALNEATKTEEESLTETK